MKQTILLGLVLAAATATGQSLNKSSDVNSLYNYTKAVTETAEAPLHNTLNLKEQTEAVTNGTDDTDIAVIPPCYTLMPIVEVQINSTASNDDDYGSTSTYTTCRARITNSFDGNGNKNFPGGMAVELRNPSGISQNFVLVFSAKNSGRGSSSIFANLPDNGGWFTFYIKGKQNNTVDKSSIIEVATSSASCDEVVIARKALMIGTDPIQTGLPQVEIEIGSVSSIDDYLTWAPKLCRIRWSNAPQEPLITYQQQLFKHASYIESASSTLDPNGSNLDVQLQNMTGTNRLRFANNDLARGNTAKNSTLSLSLSSDGTWTYFYMAGGFGNASQSDKDAVMEVKDVSSGLLLSREGMMVRIRKNANTLTTAERDRYLQALKKVDLTYNDYIDFVKTHSRDNTGAVLSQVATRQSHKGSAFLPWHRTFVLDFERLMQATDPSVALPYWKFDANAPNVFNSNFMGSNSTTTSNMAVLASTNPIVNWNLPGENVPTGIQRKTPYGDSKHPVTATETATLALGSPGYAYSSFKTMEDSYHSPAHAKSGTVSWIRDLVTATRDPLFFLLHCNVDRTWAKWQWLNNRYNTNDSFTYDLQGSFYSPAPGVPGPNVSGNRTLGQYIDDTMWPWDNITGGTSGSASERPHIAVITPFPVTLGASLPGNKPTIKSVIDYICFSNNTPDIGLGYGYDDFYPY